MRGHVRQRGKAWAFVIDEPRGADGKRRQRWRSGFATRKAAERALADAMKAMNDGAYVEPSRQTLGQFLEGEWLQSMRARLRPSTFASYSSIVKVHVVPESRRRPTPGAHAGGTEQAVRGSAAQRPPTRR